MIKLELTHDDFVFVLGIISENIQPLEMSDDALDEKVERLRRYSSEELTHLLNGLRNGELEKSSSEWLQAIQYVYSNQEIQFIEVKPLLTKRRVAEKIKDFIEDNLESVKRRFSIILLGLPVLTFTVFFLTFFVFYEFVWWKAFLYLFSSMVLYIVMINIGSHFLLKEAIRSAHYSFVQLILKYRISYRYAIELLKEHLVARKLEGRKVNMLEERLFKSFYEKMVSFVSNSNVLTTERQIQKELLKTIAPIFTFLHRRTKFSLTLLLLWLLTTILVFFVFNKYEEWWKAFLYSMGSLFAFLVFINIANQIALKTILHSISHVFIEIFAKNYSTYLKVSKLLEEEKEEIKAWKIGYINVGIPLYKALNIKGRMLNNKEVRNGVRNILSLLQIVNTVSGLIIFLTALMLAVVLPYYFIFYQFLWWQTSLFVLFTTPGIVVIIARIISYFYKILIITPLIRYSLSEVSEEDYLKIILLLERVSRLKKSKKLFHPATVLLAILKPKPNKLELLIRSNPLNTAEFVIVTVIVLPLVYTFGYSVEKVIIYVFSFFVLWTLSVLFVSMVLARWNHVIAIQLLKEQRSFNPKQSYFGIPLVNIQYSIFCGYQTQGQIFWQQKKWLKARKQFQVVLATLKLLVESKANTTESRTEYCKRLWNSAPILPQLSDTLFPEWVKTNLYIGMCHHLTGEFSQAREAFEQSLIDYKNKLSEIEQSRCREIVARTELHLGVCFFQLGDLSQAKKHLEITQDQYQQIGQETEDKRGLDIAQTWTKLIDYFLGEGNMNALKEENILYEPQPIEEDEYNDFSELVAIARGYLGNSLLLQGCLSSVYEQFSKKLEELNMSVEKDYDKRFLSFSYLMRKMDSKLHGALEEYYKLIENRKIELLSEQFIQIGSRQVSWASFTKVEYTNFLERFPDASPILKHCMVDIHQYAEEEHVKLLRKFSSDKGVLPLETEKLLLEQVEKVGSVTTQSVGTEASINDISTIEKSFLKAKETFLRNNQHKVYIDTEKLSSEQKQRLSQMLALSELTKRVLVTWQDKFSDLYGERQKQLSQEEKRVHRLTSAISFMRIGISAKSQLKEHEQELQILVEKGHIEFRLELLATYFLLIASLLEENASVTEIDHLVRQTLDLLKHIRQDEQGSLVTVKMTEAIAFWHISERRGNRELAESFGITSFAIDWLESVMGQVSSKAIKPQLIGENLSLYQLATQLANELGQPEQAYITLERSKTRILVEQMQQAQIEPSDVSELIREKYHILSNDINSLEWQLIANPTAEKRASLLQKLKEKKLEFSDLSEEIAQHDPVFVELLQPQPLTRIDFTPLIDPDELVIVFEQCPEELRLYPITKRRGVQKVGKVILTQNELKEAVSSFNEGINNKNDRDGRITRKAITRLINWLSEKLATAIQQLLKQYTPQKLTLIPYQLWHLLPLHLLKIENDYLAFRYKIRYLPSLKVLHMISNREPPIDGNGCIIADPQENLEDAKEEGNKIQELRIQCGFQDTLLSSGEATFDAVSNCIKQAEHIHFACHGTFEENLKSALSLASDTKLTAIELFTKIRLPNTRLVILSACETAQIQNSLSDEYMGLSSGFLFAGAHNVLASLWRIDTVATPTFMVDEFYPSLLQKHLPLLEALQHSQQQMHEIKAYEHPYFWGAFVLIGEGK